MTVTIATDLMLLCFYLAFITELQSVIYLKEEHNYKLGVSALDQYYVMCMGGAAD